MSYKLHPTGIEITSENIDSYLEPENNNELNLNSIDTIKTIRLGGWQ